MNEFGFPLGLNFKSAETASRLASSRGGNMQQHPKWTLRERSGVDGVLQDHLSITRFARNRVFDVHLPRGKYELHAVVRRDEEALLQPGVSSSATDDDDNTSEETSSSNNNNLEGSEVVTGGIGAAVFRSRLKGIRHNISSAARKTLETVTVGTMGRLSVECDVSVLDNSTGHEVFSIQHQLSCANNAAVEIPLAIDNDRQSIRIKFHSTSTIHAIQIYAAIYEKSPHDNGSPDAKRRTRRSNRDVARAIDGEGGRASGVEEEEEEEDESSGTTAHSGGTRRGAPPLSTAPFEMLRRAVFGSAHPSRAGFSRSLSMSCFMTLFGFVLGSCAGGGGGARVTEEIQSFVMGIGGFVAWFWFCRVVLLALVSVIPLLEGGNSDDGGEIGEEGVAAAPAAAADDDDDGVERLITLEKTSSS